MGTQPRHLGSYGTGLQPSAFGLQPSRSGVALIITLILLGVVTFMAIAFLALSRRERGAVTTVTDTAGARYAADTALASAEAQIMANVLATTNPLNFGLIVSTNYINPLGFQTTPLLSSSFTNVNYQYPSGTNVNGGDFLQLLTNLWYSPRPPVFFPMGSTGSNDFRFYLDLNRNGRFDSNGVVANLDNNGDVIFNGGFAVTNFQVGDPEWIGVLQRPDAPYGPNNPFVARYAFIAVPVGNTLDLNAIHNNARMSDQVTADDGFFRNQGVGSWEINLAAFLADSNTNQWFLDPFSASSYYDYEPTYISGPLARYRAFDDALWLLNHRYAGSYTNLATVDNLYGVPGQIAFRNDNIDGYSDGQLQTTFDTNADFVFDNPSLPWAGADNTNHYFSHQELFNSNEISTPFVSHLLAAGQTNSTYDRYTFYRLLSQLGTDSTPESGKMNVNYVNVDVNGNVIPDMETNFISWTNAVQFFTNAADRLLRTYTTQWRNGSPTNFAATFYSVSPTNFSALITMTNPASYPAFGVGQIPVLMSNQFVYSSAVNRLLQLAANMYDATTTNFYPSVFRPIFEHDNFGNVFIIGYTNLYSVIGTGDLQLALPYDVASITNLSLNFTPVRDANGYVNVYGVPWIIGAKKGFPNFNEFVMENVVGITRRLQLTRNTNTTPVLISGTNQMYLISVNTSLGVDLWNSYAAQYNGTVSGWVRENLSMSLTNTDPGFNAHPGIQQPIIFSTNCPIFESPWPGAGTPQQWSHNNSSPYSTSFALPLGGTFVMLTNSVYRTPYAYNTGGTVPGGYPVPSLIPTNYLGLLGMTGVYETNTPGFPLPQWGLLTTNRLQVFMLDQPSAGGPYHVIDYAHFEQISSRDLNAEIFSDDVNSTTNAGVWNTNIDNALGIPYGILNQILISRRMATVQSEDGSWKSDPQAASLGGTEVEQQNAFDVFFKPYGSLDYYAENGVQKSVSNLLSVVQAPYSPTRYAVGYTIYESNDPLVHYLASDLYFSQTNQIVNNISLVPTLGSLDWGRLNKKYQPWGVSGANLPSYVDQNPYNLAYKDPLVRSSDNWDFPTNKLPGIGWLGRVHRGTPWQTVYLKATNLLSWAETNPPYANGLNTWYYWAYGTINLNSIAAYTAPVQDRLLFDLFTTAFNDNATRGTLSVNQNHLAAWSAVFSGVVVLSNNLPDIVVGSLGSQFYQEPLPGYSPPSYSVTNIQPSGSAGLNSALGQLVQGIANTRATFANADGLVGAFEHVGDILAVPQLTDQSPFLKAVTNGVNDVAQQINGISDEMYEWLPQQTMSLLRCSPAPRYVIYCYGQTLKPAPDGVYSGGGLFFGMVTNYQVVSEIATRAVVRFNSTLTNILATGPAIFTNGIWIQSWTNSVVVTNNNAVIEQFNLLPPD
ncbi:MAG: hypothetical protein ACLQAH_08275 [Limisphaerales bacterium]